MLAPERQLKIAEIIQARGSVQVEELAQELNVSTMTIRRDLEKLQKNNVIERCHGGAVAKQEMAYTDKRVIHKGAKISLASVCAELVFAGDTIFLDAGTTSYEIAKVILEIPDVTVVTNDLEIAGLLKMSRVELFLLGGMVQKSTGSMLGYYATQMLGDFQFDVGFFGAASINEELEVMTPTVDKAFLKRLAVERCKKSYLVVDESKFGRQAMAKVNHLSQYSAVVTNRRFTDREKAIIRRTGVHEIHVNKVREESR